MGSPVSAVATPPSTVALSSSVVAPIRGVIEAIQGRFRVAVWSSTDVELVSPSSFFGHAPH
jgi:hypothetical protein